MALSVRLFGLSSLEHPACPRRCAGVAAVGLLYATVRRWFGPAAGLLAGAVMALTPVAVLMFRFNNPDALLVLLLVGCGLRHACARSRRRAPGGCSWPASSSASASSPRCCRRSSCVPAFALVYLLAAPTGLWRRIRPAPGRRRRHGRRRPAGGSRSSSSSRRRRGRTSAARRPTASSTSCSATTASAGSPATRPAASAAAAPAGRHAGMWGATGWAADVRRRDRRAGRLAAPRRAAAAGRPGSWLTWGPPGPTVAAPPRALGRLAARHRADVQLHARHLPRVLHGGPGARDRRRSSAWAGSVLWRRRRPRAAVCCSRSSVAVTAWSVVACCWRAAPTGTPGCAPTVLVVGLVAAVALLARAARTSCRSLAVGRHGAGRSRRRGLAGPAAYALSTAATPHTGSILTAGPAVAGAAGRSGGGLRRRACGWRRSRRWPARRRSAGGRAASGGPGGRRGPAGGRPPGARPGRHRAAQRSGRGRRGGHGRPARRAARAERRAASALLQADASTYRWVAATVGANNAAGYQLASGRSR